MMSAEFEFIILFGWIGTLFMWFLRERQHSQQQQETIRLMKAESLADYDAGQTPKKTKQQNYMKHHVERAKRSYSMDEEDQET